MDLAASIRDGDRRALARGLTWVENDLPEGGALLAALPPRGAHRIGITGPPGAGKSTLVAALAAGWRADGRQVGILAVDPSSPFTGGALLGDRIRMAAHAGDEGVFVRSLASRGASGGLSAGVHDAADLLDGAGFDPVVLETVGVGQVEVDVCEAADTTVVVLAPGAGDAVQGMKAGLVEIADLLVVNQADRDGAAALVAALTSAVELAEGPPPAVMTTVATAGRGVDAVRAWLDDRTHDGAALAARRRRRAAARIRRGVDRRRSAAFWDGRGAALDRAAADVAEGRRRAAEAIAELLGDDLLGDDA